MKPLFNKHLLGIHRSLIVSDSSAVQLYYNELGLAHTCHQFNSFYAVPVDHVCYIGPMANVFLSHSCQTLKRLTLIDFSQASLDYSMTHLAHLNIDIEPHCMDDEHWKFPENHFDVIFSNMSLHWANQVHKLLANWILSLKPDGILAGNCVGGETLHELRVAMALAEAERTGISNARVVPMIVKKDLEDALLMLSLNKVFAYSRFYSLLFDEFSCLHNFLRMIGETSAIEERKALSQDASLATECLYTGLFTDKHGESKGKLGATLEVLHFLGQKVN